ncbi:elongin C [Coemansia aciculifera]|uniref:Elongin C n=1 Tax=Coemansia aciculifera TaxID=417176 RepID=A0ACC1M029_9FUNG|nr:elongin C [Coemansia aciculifera]KAJ2910632.1 elongin C [Coemansia aciculifera]
MSFVKLISGDGFEFVLDKQVAEHSPTIKNMLDTSHGAAFTEALTNQVKFPEIKGKVLEKVCQYLYYKHRYAAEGATDRVPAFPIDLESSLELLVAADYLDC